MKGLEPTLLTELDPKSSAATNYATSAFECAKVFISFNKTSKDAMNNKLDLSGK